MCLILWKSDLRAVELLLGARRHRDASSFLRLFHSHPKSIFRAPQSNVWIFLYYYVPIRHALPSGKSVTTPLSAAITMRMIVNFFLWIQSTKPN